MTRVRWAPAVVLAALVLPGAAQAHPLGNFSVNHLTEVSVSRGEVRLRYVLDQAEIPTFQERGTPVGEILARKRAEVLRRLVVTSGGRRLPLAVAPGASITFPPGQGGLRLTRVVLSLRAPVRLPARIAVHDGTFPGRVGWKAVVARPGTGTAVRADVPSGDPTHELRAYPQDLLSSPRDLRDASLAARPGAGTLAAADGGRSQSAPLTTNRSGDGFAGVFERAAEGRGILLVLVLAALGWGAVHALSPGHGKAMVAAYLIGTRGTPRHALALGATVTVTHTAGVFALGLVTLALSQYVLPEQLYPWLNLMSGLLVLGIGGAVLRARWRDGRRRRGSRVASGPHDHPHGHARVQARMRRDPRRRAEGLGHALARGGAPQHAHPLAQAHAQAHTRGDADAHAHAHGDADAHEHPLDQAHADAHSCAHADAHEHRLADAHAHAHAHAHGLPHDHAIALNGDGRPSVRGLIAAGASAGLIPCPSALVVLLAAVSQGQVPLGLLLIVAFSGGLAATISALGLIVVYARRVTARVDLSGRVVTVLPAASALVICGVGLLLTARALEQVA